MSYLKNCSIKRRMNLLVLGVGIFIDPAHSLPIMPLSFFSSPLLIVIHSLSMLFPVRPTSFISTSIRPNTNSQTTSQISHIPASCHQHTDPHTCVHQPMRTLPFHASYYSSNHLCRSFHPTTNKSLLVRLSYYLCRECCYRRNALRRHSYQPI